jgi:catalase
MNKQTLTIASGSPVADGDYVTQVGNLFRLMSDEQKSQLTTTIAEGLLHAIEFAQSRILVRFEKVDPDCAAHM